jgi:hypothetical protein
MALELSTLLWIVGALSWVLSAFLLALLWRSADLIPIKVGLSLLLLLPIMGPFFYFWIQSFPDSNHPELKEDISYDSRSWRERFERVGMLPGLVQHWRKRRRK